MVTTEEIKKLFTSSQIQGMDEKDLHIICILEHEGEMELKRIGEKVGLSAPAVSTRIKRLKEKGILITMVPLTRIDRISFARDLILMIAIEPGADINLIIKSITETSGVKSLYQIIGEYDFYIQLCCLGDDALEESLRLIHAIPGLSRISKTLIRHKLKENFHCLND
ncbi:MAG: Lrp/AsnC family transcriptional regulator [Candidatus Hodarchaeales archaeon]